MTEEGRIKWPEQEVQLCKSKKECEHSETQKIQAVIKADKAQLCKIRPKVCTGAVDLKQEDLAKLEAEVSANDRTDGLGKLSALEIANQKLSVQIEDLIMETKREIYGMDATTREHNKQDGPISEKNHVVHPHLYSSTATTRRTSKFQTGHPPSMQKNPVAQRSVARVLAHQDEADRQRPVIPNVPLNSNRNVVFAKQLKSAVCNPFDIKNSEAMGTANLHLPPSRERKMRQCPSIVQKVDQNIRSNFSNNLLRSSPVSKRQTSPRLLSHPVTQDMDPGKCSPTPNADKRADREIQREISKPSPKKMAPRKVKVNQITDKRSNEISIDLTRSISRKEQEKSKFDEVQSQNTTRMSPRGDILVQGKTPLPLKMKNGRHQQGDFQHQLQVTPNPYSNQSDDESLDDLRLLLENISPRPANSNSSTSQNSSPSISPRNNNLRPWYELLPIPNVEFVGKYQDLNNACSSDSDSSGHLPLKPSMPTRREGDTWTYLGDQTALMPRPVAQKNCKFLENFDSLSLTDEDTEFKGT